MITLVVKITPEFEAMIDGLGEDVRMGIRAGMGNLLAELEAHAVKEAPVDTSDLVNSITTYMTDRGLLGVLKATAPHAAYVHEGTGLYGPHKQMIVIRPRDKKALFWPGARHPVRQVRQKGQRPNPFFIRAIDRTAPQRAFEDGLRNYLSGRRH